MPSDAVTQYKKNITATALQENANGKKANNAMACTVVRTAVAIGLNLIWYFSVESLVMEKLSE
jgi:hypothetical protein